MKKIITAALLILLSITLIGCNNHEYNNYVDEINYDLFDYHYIVKNQIVEVDYEILEQLYDYDSIAYYVENEKVVKINYQGDIKGRDAGKSLVKATLYKGDLAVTNVALGYFIIIDLESDSITPINTYSEFQSLLQNNRFGSFYLNANISFPDDYDFQIIEDFRGMLINPFNYEISNIHNTEAIFKDLKNAYIDGLIIKNSAFTGEDSAVLALNTNLTMVKNTHVFNSNVQATNSAAGLVINSVDSTYEMVSFEGNIESNLLAGGLFAQVKNGQYNYSYYIDNFLLNSYAYADITVNDALGKASGLVGEIHSYGVIESSYFGGNLTAENTFPISYNLRDELIYYISVFTTESTTSIDREIFAMGEIYHVSDDALYTGTVLPGLEAFTYNPGSIPKN